jgi:hypothetical protein
MNRTGYVGDFTKDPFSKISRSYWTNGTIHVYKMGRKWVRAIVPRHGGAAESSRHFPTRHEAMNA